MIIFLFTILFTVQANVFTNSTTFCVGGFNMNSPYATNNHACNKWSVSAVHPGCWHLHISLIRNTRTGECFNCWDECDSSCDWDFMRNNPHFQSEYDISKCKNSDPSEVFQHVMGGVELESTASKGKPLQPELIIRKGPYSPGEALQLTAQLNDDTGTIAKDDGQIIAPDDVTFTVSHNGTALTEVQGQMNPDGTVTATITIPESTSIFSPIFDFLGLGDTYTITAKVKGDNLPSDYTLAQQTTKTHIKISDCVDALSLQTPHKSIASLIPIGFQSSLKSGDLSNVSLVYELKVMDPTTLKDPSTSEWTISADSTGNASWTPPELTHSYLNTPVNVYVTGTKGGATVCPSKTQTLSLSGQSVLPEVMLPIDNPIELEDDFGLFSQTKYCITGQPCKMNINFKRNPDIPSPILDAPDATVKVINNNGDALFQGKMENTLEFEFTPQKEGTLTPIVQVESASLEQKTALESSQIEIRDPINLGLNSPLNFGFVDEDSWRSKCKIIDVKQAGLRPQDALRFEVKNIDPSCNMELLYLNNPSNTQFLDAVIVPIDEQGNGKVDLLLPKTTEFGICAKTDACGAYDSEEDDELNIIPIDPRLRQFQHTGKVEWTSEKEPFYKWDCWGKIITYTSGVFSLLMYAYGSSIAARFAIHHEIIISSSKNMNRNRETITLKDQRSKKLVLFKGEQVTFDYSLESTRKSPALTCFAGKVGYEIEGVGLQEYDTHENKWKEVDGRIMPSSTRIYRFDGTSKLYFKFSS